MFIFDPDEFDNLYRYEDYDNMNDLEENEEIEDVDYQPYDYEVPVFCPFRQLPNQPGRPPRPPMGGGMGNFPGGPGVPPGGGFPGGHGAGQSGPPKSAPPSFTPQQKSGSMLKIDAGSIRPCTFRFVFIWLNNGRGFWAWLTFVGRNSVSGWRWTGRRWVFFGIDTRRIASFTCF